MYDLLKLTFLRGVDRLSYKLEEERRRSCCWLKLVEAAPESSLALPLNPPSFPSPRMKYQSEEVLETNEGKERSSSPPVHNTHQDSQSVVIP